MVNLKAKYQWLLESNRNIVGALLVLITAGTLRITKVSR
jgi:hypothetical protein